MSIHRAFAAAALAAGCSLAAAADPATHQPDPLDSPRWGDMRKAVFPPAAKVAFDPRVKVVAPLTAENALNVPVSVDASALADVKEVLVFADFNPITRIVRFEPTGAHPGLGFRIKLQQSSPVRAAARTGDGRWHVGGTWVNTTGGGCTVPGVTRADGSWNKTLNQVHARFFSNLAEGTRRLRLQIMHPMDTGLVAGVPALYIERLELQDAAGQPWWRMQLHEPVSENPLLTIEMPLQGPQAFRLSGQDNNGNRIDAQVRA